MSLIRMLAEIERLKITSPAESLIVATDVNPRLERGVARLSKSKGLKESVLVEIERGRYIVRGHKKGKTKQGTDRKELFELLMKWAKE